MIGRSKRARSEAENEQEAAMLTLMRLGWGQENAAFRQLFTAQFIPGGTKEQSDWFNELQRISISPDDAVRFRIAVNNFDVSSLPAQVSAPTLVMHARLRRRRSRPRGCDSECLNRMCSTAWQRR